jgi:hypothetical protein
MSVAKFSVGRSGGGGANAEYITREKAAEKIEFHNLKKLEAETREEARTNAIAYAHTREDSELAKSKNGRTHYRLLLTFDRKEASEKVVEESKEFLENNLPKARAIIAVHQDTDHTHAHVWIDARQIDDKKIHLGYKTFRTLDERWTEQFDKSYGTNYAPEYKAKKRETKDWKRSKKHWQDFYIRLGDGDKNLPLPTKPQRAADIFDPKYWREKEITNLGVNNIKDEKIRLGTDQSDTATGNRFAETTEQLDSGTESITSGAESTSRLQTATDIRRTRPSQRGDVLAPQDSRKDFGEELGNTGRIIENGGKFLSGTDLHDVYNERTEIAPDNPDRQEIFEKQFYQRELRGFTANRSDSLEQLSNTFTESTRFGTANVEAFTIINIVISEPQFNPNTEAYIQEITEMMKNNLDEQNKQMSLRAQTMFEERLQLAATVPPDQAVISYVNKFNGAQESEEKRINPEGKTKLETLHDILSNVDRDEKRNILDQTAKSIENKVVKEKQEARVQEMEVSSGMSM